MFEFDDVVLDFGVDMNDCFLSLEEDFFGREWIVIVFLIIFLNLNILF